MGTTHVDLHTSLKRIPVENDTQLFKKLYRVNKAAHTSLDQIIRECTPDNMRSSEIC